MTRRQILAASLSTWAWSAEPPLREDGFTPLFDGESLSGWSIQQGPDSAFYAENGAIVVHEGSGFPTWLRYDRRFENFEFRCDVFIEGWSNGGIFLHAPEYGRPTETGFKVNIFQKRDEPPLKESIGAIFPVLAPSRVNVTNGWNTVRVLMDSPVLRVWINGEMVQDVDIDSVADFRYRFRSGYIGIESLSYPLRFRNLRVRELPPKTKWDVLYAGPGDLSKWKPLDTKATWKPLGPTLRADGSGYLATVSAYRDFAFQCYIRGSKHHNGGIIFRGATTDTLKHYEIQLHDVEGAVYPTGSLYHYRRAIYPRIQAEEWFPFQLFVKGKDCLVRINGDTVTEFSGLEMNDEAPIMLQAHAPGRWVEYKEILIRRL